MVDVSADAVLPPAGPDPSPGCIPTVSLWEKTYSWGTLWAKLCLYQEVRLVLYIWSKYQSQALKREGGSSWATSALTKMTCVLASESNHGDTGKSSIIFHTTSTSSHCLCGKNSPGCFVDVLYIAQTLTASTYTDTYCVAKKNSGR